MRGILLVSHGGYAEEMKKSITMVAGNLDNIHACCLLPEEDPTMFRKKLDCLNDSLDNYEEILIFADLMGGTPCNVATTKFLNRSNTTIISGMNFPMVLIAALEEMTAVEKVISAGIEGIIDVKAKLSALDDED